MKKLKFEYEMKLSFSCPVTDHKFQLRCIPATGPRQQIVDVEMALEPAVKLHKLIDSFDSVVVTGYIPAPHDVFSYKVSGIAFVDNENTKAEPFKPLYRFDSALTIPGPSIDRLIETCAARIATLPAEASPIERARVVMGEVYRAFEYAPGSTTIRTTAEASTDARRPCPSS